MSNPVCEKCDQIIDGDCIRVSAWGEIVHKDCLIPSDQSTEYYGDGKDLDSTSIEDFIIGKWSQLDDRKLFLDIKTNGECDYEGEIKQWFLLKNSYNKYRLILRGRERRTAFSLPIESTSTTANTKKKIIVFKIGLDTVSYIISTQPN